MNCVVYILALIIFFWSPLVRSYDEDRARANLAHDFAICSAFYFIMSKTLKNTGDASHQNAAQVYYKAASRFFAASAKLSNIKVAEARWTMSLEEMAQEIDFNYANISILHAQYLKLCKNLFENPNDRMMYWLQR